MKINTNTRRSITIAMLIAAPIAMIGCSTGPSHAGDINSIRWDPTPAMHTLAKRDSDRLNSLARMKDSNLRMLSTDLDRAFYLDRPSRLYRGIKP